MTPQIALDVSPLNTLLGTSPAMKQVHRLVSRMGKSRFPVLVLGETGTGKEVVARAIHNMDGRGPFRCYGLLITGWAADGKRTCSVMPKALSPARTIRSWACLDAANGGTAFFDEIGELPIEMQQKLLRVLQEKEFRAIGALSSRTSNFRIIAATNRDLSTGSGRKTFSPGSFLSAERNASETCAFARTA